MDFAWLSDLAKQFTGIGRAPSPKEIIAMKCSVRILAEKHNHDLYHFWGKITGTARSYLIVCCYTGGLLGEKTYYASLDGVSWFGLPLVTESLLQLAAHMRGRITGNPLTKIPVRCPRKPVPFKEFEPLVPPKPRNEEEEEEEEDKPEDEPEKEEEEDQIEEEELPEYEEFMLSEDQKIATIVHLIDRKGLIFPQDSLLWKSTTEVGANPLFKGVPAEVTLDDFCRLDKTVRGEGARVNGIVDTMPLLSEDLPARGWKISSATNSGTVKITSRLWPGLAFLSKGEQWGTVYLGSGERNLDFLFATE